MRLCLFEHQFPKVLINGDKNPLFARRPLQDDQVTRIIASIAGLDDVMSLPAKPVSESVPRTTVNEKPHFPVTSTASRES